MAARKAKSEALGKEPHAFWDWFGKKADLYRDIDVPEKEQLLDDLEAALHLYHPSLYFEIGGLPDGPMELVITAQGDVALFPAVERLVDAAPEMPGWEFIALKQPGGFGLVIDYRGVEVAPEACWFLPLVARSDPGALGLRVACPGYSPEVEDALLSAVNLLLDSGLGERAATLEISHVEVCAVPGDPRTEGYIQLQELPDYLAWRRGRDGP